MVCHMEQSRHPFKSFSRPHKKPRLEAEPSRVVINHVIMYACLTCCYLPKVSGAKLVL